MEISRKRLEWARPARAAYEATIARIAGEDIHTASLVEGRVARSLALLQVHPLLGTPSVHGQLGQSLLLLVSSPKPHNHQHEDARNDGVEHDHVDAEFGSGYRTQGRH